MPRPGPLSNIGWQDAVREQMGMAPAGGVHPSAREELARLREHLGKADAGG